jgi:hypothetical protein
MTMNPRLERLYSQVELVRGIGDRQRSQLCIMSFVALLAGEDHSDDPMTASRLIRQFAIMINDEMPSSLRQSLKCFAPQIIGTRDGHDDTRARLLLNAARAELLPRIEADFDDSVEAILAGEKKALARSWLGAYRRLKGYIADSTMAGDDRVRADAACIVACLICVCARVARLADQRAWYWAKAVDLLDRLCTIGIEHARPTVSEDYLDILSGSLTNRPQALPRRMCTAGLWMRMRNLLPALAWRAYGHGGQQLACSESQLSPGAWPAGQDLSNKPASGIT